jgi:hypothetical protein
MFHPPGNELLMTPEKTGQGNSACAAVQFVGSATANECAVVAIANMTEIRLNRCEANSNARDFILRLRQAWPRQLSSRVRGTFRHRRTKCTAPHQASAPRTETDASYWEIFRVCGRRNCNRSRCTDTYACNSRQICSIVNTFLKETRSLQ